MNAKEALKALGTGKSWPVYILYGDEPFKVDEFVLKAAETIGGMSRVDRLDGTTCKAGDVFDALQSAGDLFSNAGQRIVLVRNAHALKNTDSLYESLMEKKPVEGENLLFLVLDTIDARRKFHSWAKKNGYALEFKKPRDEELIQWAHYLAKKRKTTLDPEAAEVLAIVCEGSLYRLDSEIEKARLCVEARGAESVIGADDASLVGAGQGATEMSDLIRALQDRKKARALLVAERHIDSQEEALGFVGYLTWSLQNQEANYGRTRARKMTNALLSLDERLKTSSIDPKLAVENFILEN